MKLTKRQIKAINTLAKESWVEANRILETWNLVHDTGYEILNKRVVYAQFEKEEDGQVDLHYHDALANAEE